MSMGWREKVAWILAAISTIAAAAAEFFGGSSL